MKNEIKKFRQSNGGLSQDKFSKLLGVSRVTVANWERGEYQPDLPTMLRILSTSQPGDLSWTFAVSQINATLAPLGFQLVADGDNNGS